MTHYRHTQVRASMTKCNIQAGKVVVQFEIAGDELYTLPTIALLTGEKVTLDISSDQTVLLLEASTGEIIDDPEQMQIETEEPEEVQADEEQADTDTEGDELPPAATAYDDELDEIFGTDEAA